MYNIEKKVPIPVFYDRGAPPKYPFRQMEIGDSFVVEGSDQERTRAQHAAHTFAQNHSKFKFTTRSFINGMRIWRIKKK